MDTSLLSTLAMMAPDLMGQLELCALILERVAALAPIGRRALAARLNLTEREVRSGNILRWTSLIPVMDVGILRDLHISQKQC